MNMGFRQEVLNKKGAFIVTVSDVFNTMKEAGIRDTPEIYQETSRTRSARMIYAGFTYSFGNNKKKEKDNSIKFDNQL
jgi:hypothetical protein